MSAARSRDARAVAVRLGGGGAALAIGLSAVGWLIVLVLSPAFLGRWENGFMHWLYANRTPALDSVTHVGSYLSETVTCIGLLVVLALAFRVWLGRWRESVTLFAAITGELLVFLVVTFAVRRERPDVPQLDAAPPTSSFPSGHTAAAVALYGCIAVVLARNLRRAWLAQCLVVGCVLVPVVVAVSRLYRGMHYPSDVLFGAIGGGLWLLIVLTTLLPAAQREVQGTSGQQPRPDTSEAAAA